MFSEVRIFSQMALAWIAASGGFSLGPSSNTTNSSPPRRATVSLSRMQAQRRWATCCSSRSPRSWPRVSLRALKLSRSIRITAFVCGLRMPPASTCCRRSSMRRRLARPVSWS
ncbi:hypothetical protein D9M73_158650 [compost metagenome]